MISRAIRGFPLQGCRALSKGGALGVVHTRNVSFFSFEKVQIMMTSRCSRDVTTGRQEVDLDQPSGIEGLVVRAQASTPP